jgi:hypothetical protein
MLRITVQDGDNAQVIRFEGKIIGPWVDEIDRVWCSLTPSLGTKELRLDVREVAFVDVKGTELLRKIYQKTKARFLADSPLTRYFADQAMRQSPKGKEKGV